MKKEAPKEITGGAKTLLIILCLLVFAPILFVAAIFYLLWGCILYLSVWLGWKQQLVLFVYSNSPIWKDYLEKEIIPLIQEKAVILNWSERKSWRNSIPTLAFRYFGGSQNFNPIAIVFRPFQPAKTFRFYQAFKKFKHGDSKEVEEIKDRLFRNLKIKTPSFV